MIGIAQRNAVVALAVLGAAAWVLSGTRGADGSEWRLPEEPAAEELREALAHGDPEEADAALATVAERHRLVGDHVQLRRARRWLEAGEWERAIQAARSGLRGYPDSPLRPDLHALEGDAFLAVGNEAAARRAWGQALAAEPAAELAAELELALAGSLRRAGSFEAAADHYRTVWVGVPDLERARRAGEGLADLEPRLGTPAASARDRRRRGDALMRLQHTDLALAEYDAVLADPKAPRAERRRAESKRAQCLFRLRRYPEAMEAFSILASRDPEARISHARSRARAGDVDGAVAELEGLAREKRYRLRTRARYLAALLLEDDHPERARAHFEALARAGGRSSMVRAARWNLAWDDYRRGRHAAGERGFLRLAAEERDPIVRLRARYWAGRSAESLHPERAARGFAELAGEYPLTYYGWRARARVPDGTPLEAEREPLEEGEPALRPRQLARARILVQAGLGAEARREIALLADDVEGREERLEVAALYQHVGEYHAAQGVVLKAWVVELARGPADGDERAWRLAWPLAFDAEVGRAVRASGGRVEPALVYAIMREESGYRPAVVSTVGARGLLQIMPSTGERLARDLGLLGFDADDLFRPRVNIRLGTFYLDELGRQFDGRSSAAIGSYNAGPEAVARWIEERPDAHDDEWVEAIPYQQTRRYVKRVLRSRHAYRVLY